jgi:hypothetical protein
MSSREVVLASNNENVQAIPDQRKEEAARAELKVKTEATEAKRIANEKTYERTYSAIAAFSPRRLSARDEEQTKLRAHVAKEKARNADAEGVFGVVKAYIETFYADEQRKLERM